MLRTATFMFAFAIVILSSGLSANAITFGTQDTSQPARFPQVGALIAEFDGLKDILCTGTLIDRKVFLTASHCTAYLESIGTPAHNVWVTFDPTFDTASPLTRGTYHTNPLYGSGGQSNTYDVAVVVLDQTITGVTPARLPTANQLDAMDLQSQRFWAVGYGTVRDDKTGGQHNLSFDGIRRYVDQGFRSLTNSWLNLSMNPSVGSGGTCYGDSGGPHFIGNSNVVAAITVTGDRWCRSTDVDYRMDTPSARDFLGQFVRLP
jgi:V8-like Glu-specific endopeptidase